MVAYNCALVLMREKSKCVFMHEERCHQCIGFFSVPPSALAPDTRYEKLMEAFGGTGYLARTIPELRESLGKAMADTKRSSIINIIIDPMAQRKTQVSQECS